jgi:hypothetical protein
VVAVEMAVNGDPQAGAGAAAGLLGQLQGHALEGDDIVEADGALLLATEDAVEIDGAQGDEGRGRVLGGRVNWVV